MKSLFNITNKKLKMLFTVLFFGGMWGLVEATLGTVLHLPFAETIGVFGSSTAVMLPIAFYLMGLCYKKTNTLRAVAYMGIIAGVIKLSTFIVMGFTQKVYMPSMYIVLESLAMIGALAITRPTKVLSPKSFLTVAIASTSYLLVYLVVRQIQGSPIFTDYNTWVAKGEFYLFTANGVMLLYVGVSGAIAYGISKLVEARNWKFNKELGNKILYNPITVSGVVAVSFVATVLLALV
jgi:hypothetical protein